MKILVTGSRGILGEQVVTRAMNLRHSVLSTNRDSLDVSNREQINAVVKFFKPNAIINCAGVLPGGETIDMIKTNSLGPNLLAATGVRLVHMSTDCVFSGRSSGFHRSNQTPDPDTAYGRTKLAGESQLPNVLNVRGSFIDRNGGLIRWLRQQQGEIDGWGAAFWNGMNSFQMADTLVNFADGTRTGVVHVASEGFTTKYDLLVRAAELLEVPVTVKLVLQPRIDRTLAPDISIGLLDNLWKSL